MSCINVVLGILNIDEVDFSFPGFIPFSLVRSYRSASESQSIFGHGWGTNLGEEITIEGDNLILKTSEGRTIHFPMPKTGQSADNPVEGSQVFIDVLIDDGKKHIIFKIKNGKRLKYYRKFDDSNKYRIYMLEDLHGNAITFNYKFGLITEIIDTLGRTFLLKYNLHNKLTEVQLLNESHPLTKRISLVQYKYTSQSDLIQVKKHTGIVNSYEYQNHLLVFYTDDNGASYYNFYDDKRRCIRTWRSDGFYYREFFYDPKRFRTITVDSLGAIRVYRYNQSNLVTETVDPLGGISHFHYNDSNKITLASNQMGNATFITIDDDKRMTSKIRADGSSEQVVIDEEGRIEKHINPNGGLSIMTYNNFDDLITVKSPNGNETCYEYDERGATTAIILANGHRIVREYGKEFIRLSDEIGTILEQRFDIYGRCVKLSYAKGYSLEYIYDNYGKFVKEIGIAGGIRKFQYDNNGQLIQFEDEKGSITTYEYNKARLRTATETDGIRIEFAYNKEGKLVKVVNGHGESHTIDYDLKGRMIKQIFFDGREELYEHDLAGAITKISDSMSREITYENDALGRPIVIKCSDGTEMEFDYSPTGKIAKASRNESEIEFDYDTEDRVIYQRQNDFELFYQYDMMGKCIQIKDSKGRTYDYERDSRMRVKKLTIDQRSSFSDQIKSLAFDFEYDEIDAVTQIVMSNGLRVIIENNGWKRPVSQSIKLDGRLILEEKYKYDNSAQLIEITDLNNGKTNYEYNNTGHLLSVNTNGIESEHYNYDTQFNLILKKIDTRQKTLVEDFEYEKGNRLKRTKGVQYKYNKAGLLIEKVEHNESTYYYYSDDDLITKVKHSNGNVIEYEYDALRRRVLKRTHNIETHFKWNFQTLWSEENISSSTDSKREDIVRNANYIYDPISWSLIALVIEGKEYLTFNDHISTPRSLINSKGETVWKVDRTAWGEQLSISKTPKEQHVKCPIRFPGQYEDSETGLCYNLNRYYDPHAARYTSPDPIGLVGGMNTYTYTLNPINYIDPLGLECQNFKDGEPPTLYRGDDRDPSDICNNGFQPRNPSANISIKDHVGGDTRAWVSTTYDQDTAKRFGDGKRVYIIDNPGCGVEVDCDPEVQERQEWLKEQGIPPEESEFEIAFKNVPPQAVTGYYENTPSGWVKKSC